MCGGGGGNTDPPPSSPATTFQPIRRDDPSRRQFVWQGTPGTPANKVTYDSFGGELSGDTRHVLDG